MKTEEINPGDILYDKERKLLVKVARVDEDGVVKYSAYTDMERIFKTVPPPYRVGTHTADAYIPATDVQRKYMERNLAVCEYVNLPKNNRMETLAYIIADLKAENVELERFAKAIYSFVKDNKIYMKKGTSCGYKQGHPAVSSTACLECKSCLGIIEGLGVICEKKFADAKVRFIDVEENVRIE